MNNNMTPPQMQPAPAVEIPPRRDQPPMSENTAIGYLVVSTGTGGKAYPLPGVRIEIYLPAEDYEAPEGTPTLDGDLVLFRTQISDESGIAEAVAIPTPAAADSLEPGSPFLPYTTAQVRVFRDGYYPTEAKEVPIFPGIKSLQYFDMIPLAQSAQYTEPSGELIIVSDEIPDHL